MDGNSEMKSFFDKLAPSWDNNAEEYEIRERITSMMGLGKNSLIADIGCGQGVMFQHLLKTEPRGILAIDISGEMLEHAKKMYPDERITYMNEDILQASLPHIDAAVIFNAYPHFMDKKALAKKLAENVRPGGLIVIAHSLSKEKINCIHKDCSAEKLSVPLQTAEKEANEFRPYFVPEKIIDEDELYFIKMTRLSP